MFGVLVTSTFPELNIETPSGPGGLLLGGAAVGWMSFAHVNVFVGADICSATIAHSYFVVTDGEGTVVAATPAITRQY